VASDALSPVSVAILTASRAFIDFSTSGLEPLHVLLALLVVPY
jgi:hypothetical protein